MDKGFDALKNYVEVEEEKQEDESDNDEWKTKMKNLIPDFIDMVIKAVTKLIGVYLIIVILGNM